MDWQKISRSDWQGFFDGFSRTLRRQEVEIQIESIGGEPRWTSLKGLTYDPKSDVFEVLTANLDHMISAPSSVEVVMDDYILRSVRIGTSDGLLETVSLKIPLILDAP